VQAEKVSILLVIFPFNNLLVFTFFTQTIKDGQDEVVGMICVSKDTNETEILGMVGKTDMLSFANLAEIAKSMGYQAQGYKISREIFEKTKVPLLVLVVREADFPHFVVVINQSGDFVNVFDPSFGDYIASKKDFFSIWEFASGGFALVVLPPEYKTRDFSMNLPPDIFFAR
jgi:predicted double-glycine peptidase